MPFKSKAQARFMFSQHPKIAKEFAQATPNMKKLPPRVVQGHSYKMRPGASKKGGCAVCGKSYPEHEGE